MLLVTKYAAIGGFRHRGVNERSGENSGITELKGGYTPNMAMLTFSLYSYIARLRNPDSKLPAKFRNLVS